MKKYILLLLFIIFVLCGCKTEPNYAGIKGKKLYRNQEALEYYAIGIRPDGYYQIITCFNKISNQEVIIIPSLYKGIPVLGFGLPRTMYLGYYETIEVWHANDYYAKKTGVMESNQLKTLYFGAHHTNKSIYTKTSDKRVFMSDLYYGTLSSDDMLYIDAEFMLTNILKPINYYKKSNLINVFSKNMICQFLNDEQLMKKHLQFDDDEVFDIKLLYEYGYVAANIEFYYNIDSAPCKMYWIDYEKDQTLIFDMSYKPPKSFYILYHIYQNLSSLFIVIRKSFIKSFDNYHINKKELISNINSIYIKTFYFLFHLAYNFNSTKFSTSIDSSIMSLSKCHLLMHSGSLYHPKNSYPSTYGTGGSKIKV